MRPSHPSLQTGLTSCACFVNPTSVLFAPRWSRAARRLLQGAQRKHRFNQTRQVPACPFYQRANSLHFVILHWYFARVFRIDCADSLPLFKARALSSTAVLPAPIGCDHVRCTIAQSREKGSCQPAGQALCTVARQEPIELTHQATRPGSKGIHSPTNNRCLCGGHTCHPATTFQVDDRKMHWPFWAVEYSLGGDTALAAP